MYIAIMSKITFHESALSYYFILESGWNLHDLLYLNVFTVCFRLGNSNIKTTNIINDHLFMVSQVQW